MSDEHGERFHQEIGEMKIRYNAKPFSAMLAHYSPRTHLVKASPRFCVTFEITQVKAFLRKQF